MDMKGSLPATLIISSIGYQKQEVTATNVSAFIKVSMVPESTLGQEVVVSATRTPSSIMTSPVTIERISAADIRNSTAVSYYDIIVQ